MQKAALVVRILLGLMLVIFGLNKFFQFMPAMQFAPSAMEFMKALMATGYMLKLIALVEIATGALLLLNRFVALALVLLAPLTVNILLFHLFLDVSKILPGLLVAIMQAYLAYVNRAKFSTLLSAD